MADFYAYGPVLPVGVQGRLDVIDQLVRAYTGCPFVLVSYMQPLDSYQVFVAETNETHTWAGEVPRLGWSTEAEFFALLQERGFLRCQPIRRAQLEQADRAFEGW